MQTSERCDDTHELDLTPVRELSLYAWKTGGDSTRCASPRLATLPSAAFIRPGQARTDIRPLRP